MTQSDKEYPLSPQDLRGLQQVELEMLLELDRICKKHDIRYCIIAGTLLGAVRHQGFIPWDDDLDIAMLRPEYERLLQVCETELDKSRFFFQDYRTDPEYRWGYGKLRRRDTEFLRLGQEHIPCVQGIFLDIFPLDNVPDQPVLRGIHNAVCTVIRKLLWSKAGAKAEKKASLRGLYRVLSLIPRNAVFRLYRRHYGFWNKRQTGWVRTMTFPTPRGRPYGYRREWYTQLADCTFEGHRVPGPRDYDGYLSYKFGNYMELPPPEQRKVHPVSRFKLPE